ncbi:polysaccharide deacetylase family protein [Halococcus sp. AFM35]|uniref:polysaccharide deacetylase family protein n=1 Tax=Halococcus sp. AFM35 TaxID=3421653 RepID=UPI003EBA3527
MSNRAVLSVDFELFTQTPAYRSAPGTTDEKDVGLAAGTYLRQSLDIHDARATFFVVSSVAERHPEVIRAFAETGHEIGSHTHTHAVLTDLDVAARRDELKHSRALLRDITDQPIDGFRAPVFALPPDHFERLDEAGYTYDSSIAPCRHIPGWYGGEYTVDRPVPATQIRPEAPTDITELPVSVMPGLRLPLTGTWIRFFGHRYTLLGMKLLARRGITPVLYVHPWELVDLPPVEGVPKRVYWHTGKWMRRTLRHLLGSSFEFVTAKTAIEDATAPAGDGLLTSCSGRT